MSIFDVPLSEIRESNELAHFGVKGMRWGVRRKRKQGSRAEYLRAKRQNRDIDRRAILAANGAADEAIQNLSRSKISSRRTQHPRGAVDEYYYGNKPHVGRLDSRLLRSRTGSRRAALGRARVITAQRKRAARVNQTTAYLDSRTGSPTRLKVLRGVARYDAAVRAKRRAGGVLREYRRQRKLQKQGVTYRKAEPQPWEKGYIGNPTIKKHLKKHRLI